MLLFKYAQGKSSTDTARDYYEEPINALQPVLPAQVWRDADDIPDTAPALAGGATDGVVQYIVDEPLTLILGTTNSFYSAELVDAIAFNHGDGTSYNYTIKDSLGNQIFFGQGDWIVDRG